MLALAWLAIIGFCIIMYIILDGFTLGTGMLLVFLNPDERSLATSVILPTWDGNQTWLVLGMASLYGAFPLAFSILLPNLYLPLLVMVVALLLRGVVFEFRMKSEKGQPTWDKIFSGAALTVALVQGYILGTFVQGFNSDVEPSMWFDFMTAFSVVIGYCLLGATRLILKTEHSIQAKMFAIAKKLIWILIISIGVVSVWTPFVHPLLRHRWFNPTLMPYLAILPLMTLIIFIALFYALKKQNDRLPYWLTVAFFLCPYLGFLLSVFPYIVPYQVTILEAAAPTSSLRFILVGVCIMLPVLLAYTFYSYRIFRGKINEIVHY
jgi:cytochrome d ubiquinol oxidase subunit II